MLPMLKVNDLAKNNIAFLANNELVIRKIIASRCIDIDIRMTHVSIIYILSTHVSVYYQH